MRVEPTVWLLLFLAALPIAVSAGGQEQIAPDDEQGLSIFVSIQPQAYFVQRIAGDRARVEVLVQPGQDPHMLEPSPKQMTRLSQADLYFRIGVEFETAMLPRIASTLTALQVVDCRQGIALREMEDEQHKENDHSPEEGRDPHIWLSVINALQIARTIRDALMARDPQGAVLYERRYSDLRLDLENLDKRIARIMAPVKGKPFFVFHPSFGYFADDYGLRQIAVETGGSQPSARQLAELIDSARNLGVKVVFVQPQFSQRSAEAIAAAIGGAVVAIDPLGYDYVESLEAMARAVQQGLQ